MRVQHDMMKIHSFTAMFLLRATHSTATIHKRLDTPYANAQSKVDLLDAAVLSNNVQDVQELLPKYHRFEFTAHTIGLAMRFSGADMVADSIESNLDTIGKRAFVECPIESIVVPDGTKSIESEVFLNRKQLKSVQIPASTNLEFRAFSGCDGLANQNGAIVVNQTLFDVANADSLERRLTPLELGPAISQIGTCTSFLPEIVYRSEDTKSAQPDLKALKAGASFCFGRFPVQKVCSLRDLSWFALAVEGEKALLITPHAIMALLCRETEDAEWRTSAARKLLNGAFMDAAFTPEERDLIVPTNTVSPTTDNVFLLSLEETDTSPTGPFSLQQQRHMRALNKEDRDMTVVNMWLGDFARSERGHRTSMPTDS